MHPLRALSLSFVAASLLACTQHGKGPQLASSASQPGYAIRYADSVQSSQKAIDEHAGEVKTLGAGFVGHLATLKNVDWARVRVIVDRADAAGASAAFAEASTEDAATRAFWKDEGDAVTGKTAGNAAYAVKQGSCTVDVAGPIGFALKDSIHKQLEKRLRAKNDAHFVIERYRTSLGKENAAALEKLADDVALASYHVYVALPELRDRLATRLADRSTARSTLEHAIKEEQEFQAEPGRTDAEKKASDERIAAMTKAKTDLDALPSDAKKTLEAVDAQIAAAKKDYEDQLAALRAKIKEKAAETPKK